MNKELAQKTDEWKKLERMTFEQRQKAEAFYENELMQLIIDDYISRNYGEMRNNSTKYLIISVGTSYEPIVLNVKLLEPEKVLFLYTQKSAGTLDKVVRFCGLIGS